MRYMISLLTLMSCLLVACDGAVIPTTPVPREVAETVLQKVAVLVCPDYPDPDNPDFYRDFSATDTTYSFQCRPATGHSTTATLRWFSNQSEALAAFEARREGNTVAEFYGLPLSAWDEDYPSFPGGRKEYRVWLWQTQQWLIEVRAFDDTHYIIAPDPETVSEAIYQVGLDHRLFTIGDGSP
jgi:hypothetical protein